jgi:hypothetical protein
MGKHKWRLFVLGVVLAATIAAGWATGRYGGALAGSDARNTYGRESSFAGAKTPESFGRESSIAGSKGAETFGRESPIAGSNAYYTYGRESS